MTIADATPVVGEPLVRQYAASLVAKGGTATAAFTLLLRAQPAWSGPDALALRDGSGAEVRVLVRACVSALAVRDAMGQRQEGEYLVVLTDRPDADLGLGILSRCYDQRVVTPSMWEAVKGAFGARQVDALLARLPWVAEPLVLAAPVGGWPPAPAGVLTRDHALSNLAAALLGVGGDDLDPSSLLTWTLDAPAAAAFRQQPPAVRDGIIEWVDAAVGPVAAIALRCSTQQHSVDAVSIGLVADVLWSEVEADPEAHAARVRLEGWTGVRDAGPVAARAFADAARGAAQRMADQRDPAYPRVLARASQLFEDVLYPQGASASTLLPAGYHARLARLAAAVRIAIDDAGTGQVAGPHLASVEAAFRELLGHHQAPSDRATGIAQMAVRLVRWLALPEPQAPTTLDQAVLRQARLDAFVDWAAADVWVGSTDPQVASAWAAVFAAVRARRDVHDRQCATLLADATERGVLPDALVPVESAITRILKPLSDAGTGLLVIVIDGMSAAVAAELTEEALRAGWYEAVPDQHRARTATLAVLPTLTRYSRTSLLTGTLAAGGQAEERAGFAALTGGKVFHKADLVGAAGQALPSSVLEAIRSDARITAVVLNTVDDTLAKADPGGTDWTIASIQHLQALLEEAARSGRTVALISDHGHVVDRLGDAIAIPGAEARWRPPDTGPLDQAREVRLAGTRVLAPGRAIIAAVDESLRYGTKQAGYHGGASAAEAVIPIIVLSRSPEDLRTAGWVPAAPQAPAWWHDTVAGALPAEPVVPNRPAKPAAPGQGVLEIEVPGQPSPASGVEQALVDALLASPIYQAQKRRYGARAAADDTVRAVVTILVAHAGRAHRDTVAAAAGIPVPSMKNTLTVLRRQLNVEGYDVLSLDVDEVTVVLDVPLLRQQFLDEVPA